MTKISFHMKKKVSTIKDLVTEVIKDIFKIFGIIYVVFFLLDLARLGFVVNFLNLNIILIICIVSGIITALIYRKK